MAISPVYKENDSGEKKQIEPWGSLRWVASASIGNATGLTLGYVTINPGKENPRHAHPTCEEVLYLMKGSLTHSIGSESFEISAGDAITIPEGVFHNAVNNGDETAEMIVSYSSANRDFILE